MAKRVENFHADMISFSSPPDLMPSAACGMTNVGRPSSHRWRGRQTYILVAILVIYIVLGILYRATSIRLPYFQDCHLQGSALC